MQTIIQSRRKLKSRLDAKQDVWRPIPALMGDGNGVVEIPNQPGYVYIRLGDNDLGQAFNNRAPLTDDLAIDVGYDPVVDHDRRIFQVLGVRSMADYAGGGSTPVPNVGAHHTTHEFGGGDDVYVDWRRLMGLRVGRPVLLTVTVDQGVIFRGGVWLPVIAQTTPPLTVPGLSTQAYYALIALDSAGVVTIAYGPPVAIATLTIANCPVPAAGEIPLAAVRLHGGQTVVTDTPSAPDIVDLRFPTYTGMSGGPGGLDTQIQYNDGGVFGGNAALTFDDGAGIVTHAGDIHFADDAIPTLRQILVNAQTTVDTDGNSLRILGSNGNGTGYGGSIDAKCGGGGTTGGGGNFTTSGGDGGIISGDGGNADLAGGAALVFGNGGQVTLAPGPGAGGGIDGVAKLYNPSSFLFAIFDTAVLAASDKTFTFPNVSGTFAIGTGIADTLAKWSATNALTNIANAAGYLYNNGTGAFSYVAAPLPGAHNVLDSTYHSDVLTGSILRGDILYGNATPKIARLALGGITGSVLTRDATDVLWSAGALSFAGAFTLTVPKTGTAATGTGTAGRVAAWVTDANTLQAAALIAPASNVLTLTATAASTLGMAVSAGKTVTLTATDDSGVTFTGACVLTIPTAGAVTAALLGTANAFTLTNTFATHIGIGTTDIEAWSASYRAIESYQSAIMFGTGNNLLDVISNAYYDGAWKYKANGFATLYQALTGTHALKVAASGVADAAITWVDALAVGATGGVHVGGTSDPGNDNLLVDGTGTITGAFGCNAKAAQTAYASGGALAAYATGAFGLNSDANMSALHAMVVKIRAALVANGTMS